AHRSVKLAGLLDEADGVFQSEEIEEARPDWRDSKPHRRNARQAVEREAGRRKRPSPRSARTLKQNRRSALRTAWPSASVRPCHSSQWKMWSFISPSFSRSPYSSAAF